MSMNFSEFKRWLGSDPGSQDPEFLRARESSPEFAAAAAESERFERSLQRALALPAPQGLTDRLKQLAERKHAAPPSRYFALAASVVLAVSAAVIVWRADSGSQSIEQYVASHYDLDGPMVLQRGEGRVASDVEELLASFDLRMTPDAAGRVGYIMLCPTPAGIGVHFMLHTDIGPVTVIVMPATPVDDGKRFDFDGMQAQLVALDRGSAAIIGRSDQDIDGMYAFVQQSILPRTIGS
jgi:hypothetical protein